MRGYLVLILLLAFSCRENTIESNQENESPHIITAVRFHDVGTSRYYLDIDKKFISIMEIIFIMGVSGSGKTTIGQLLAQALHLPFFDADDFHPTENVEKMKAGNPLNDEDRAPWLDNLNQLAQRELTQKGAVITCSALKEKYRIRLEQGLWIPPKWVFLNGDFATILERMNQREEHYMPASLLQSQFDALEIPKDALEVNIEESPEKILRKIKNSLNIFE